MAPDDGTVVDMAEHFEEMVSLRIAELGQSLDGRLDAVDARLEQVDARFDEVTEHFVEMRDFTTFCFDNLRGEMIQGHQQLHTEISGVQAGVGRVERRLDRHEELLGEILTEVRARKAK